MEGLLTFFLLMQLPDIVFAPVAAGGLFLISDLISEIKAEDAIDDACVLYVKDYTDCEPEWRWGNHEGVLDYQEMLGCPIDLLQKEIFDNTLTRLEEGKHPSFRKDFNCRRHGHAVSGPHVRGRQNRFNGEFPDHGSGPRQAGRIETESHADRKESESGKP